MTRESQKITELIHAQRLLQILGLGYDRLSQAPTDPPDMFFTAENKKISIEHSILLSEHGERTKQEIAAFEKLIERVNEFYNPDLHGILRVWVWFEYDGKLDLRKNKLDKTAMELLDLCIKYNPHGLGGIYDSTVPEEHLPRYSSRITIWGIDNAGDIGFNRNSIVISGALPIGTLRSAIEKKATNLPSYREQYDENWLLLVADGSQASQFATFRPDGIEEFQLSDFDRIYILEDFTQDIHIVK